MKWLVILMSAVSVMCCPSSAAPAPASSALSADVSPEKPAPADTTTAPFLNPLLRHARAHPAGEVAFSADLSVWKEDTRHLPIGVFDSGIGGLTVLEAILKLDAFHNETLQPGADGKPDFERERFVYFGDQANMPYGNYPAAGRSDFLRELIVKDALFLLGKRFHPAPGQGPVLTKPPVKAIVIACNTATAYGLEDIRESFRAWNIPVMVIGVVEAGARGLLEPRPAATSQASDALAKPAPPGTVAVLATVGICASGAYPAAIRSVLGRAGRPLPEVLQQGSVSLAGAIEGNPAFPCKPADIALEEVRALLDQRRQSGKPGPVDTVILGCTHFPLIQAEIEQAFTTLHADPAYAALTSAPRAYIDPADCAARELFRGLAQARLNLKAGESCVIPEDQFYFSAPNPVWPGIKLNPEGGLTQEYKYQRLPGQLEREDTVNIPLQAATLPAGSAGLVRNKLPEVWRRLSRGG